ncbi:hypothetical protein ASC75_23840 [Aminobacter sp. DSM 101952]|uniref:hypothetical protein n=1 Tax=Aminobacter sp. DSM 101952 TaxID=2735891 RepID=UPI0006F20A3D|nr:hypothetical protein [Aminobacter sp. DSM 101952]KQU72420.1 hypothetical protein ASC75_23840 [Aminobacter sp. DSM 101952]
MAKALVSIVFAAALYVLAEYVSSAAAIALLGAVASFGLWDAGERMDGQDKIVDRIVDQFRRI